MRTNWKENKENYQEDVKNFENVYLDGKLVESSMYRVNSIIVLPDFTLYIDDSTSFPSNNSSDKQNNNNPKVIEFLYGKNEKIF